MFGIDDLVGGLANVGTALIGKSTADADRNAALQQIQDQIKKLESIGIPSIEAQQRVYQQYKSAGMLTPELETAFQQGQTEMNNISTNPAYDESRLNALNSLGGIADAGGMNLTDKANLNNVQISNASTAKGARDAILSNARARGTAGSGLELAAQLSNAQNAATANNSAGLTVAAQAQQRALDAISQGGNLANTYQTTDFNQQAAKASAADAINKFNTQNSQAVQNANVAAKNSANQYNLNNSQDISNKNTGVANTQEDVNKGLLQTQFNNQKSIADSEGNARTGSANQLNQNADRTQNMWTGIGQGVGQAASAIGQKARNDASPTDADKDQEEWMF